MGRHTRNITFLLLFVFIVALSLSQVGEKQNAVPPINPAPSSTTHLNYPYSLLPGETRLDFPAAEGRQADMDSDTWFLEGVLEGQESGRRFSFIVVFYISRVLGVLPFDFYSLALYDLDSGDYGTFTEYKRISSATGFLDLNVALQNQNATWKTSIDSEGYLMPFSYHVDLPGVDHKGRIMQLVADVKAQKPPVKVGADVFNGLITVYKQNNTISYFQTGMEFDGLLTWGDHHETVKGNLGHMDRQMFPQFAGVENSLDGRDIAHEWRTFFLDNGVDFSSWSHFDRAAKNAETSYNGATIVDPIRGASYVGDIVYDTMSYRRVEGHAVEPLVPPRSRILYFPNRHQLSSASLNLQLVAEPVILETPLLAFPIEYVHGPVFLNGTMAGKRIQGIGSFERTLGLYRDFEIVTVLSDSVKHLPSKAFQSSDSTKKEMLTLIEQVDKLVNNRDTAAAHLLADGALRTVLNGLDKPYRNQMIEILNDLIAAN